MPATTNMGEAQHYWTNEQSSIKLPLVDAILLAQEIDQRVVEEVKTALLTGILANKQTELFHCTSHKTHHHFATACKACETNELQTLSKHLQNQIEEDKMKHKESSQHQHEAPRTTQCSKWQKIKSFSLPAIQDSQLSSTTAVDPQPPSLLKPAMEVY
ncbi:hypothetical protein C0992_002881 [Termitomyces sp. T32_za158]|nr:hypothetical protein C0992_002881 [Termitomyces sp. T32_za158]